MQISNLLLDENDKLRIPAFLEPDDKETDPEKVRQVGPSMVFTMGTCCASFVGLHLSFKL
jgi:hypothetical protein